MNFNFPIPRICPVGGLSSDCHVLVEGPSCGVAGVGPGANLGDGQQFQPGTFEQLDYPVVVDPSRLCIPQIEGIEVLIQTAQGYRMAVTLDLQDQLYEIDQLQGLMEGLRSGCLNCLADRADRFQLGFSRWLLLPLAQPQSQVAESFYKRLSGFQNDGHGLIEVILSQIRLQGQIQGFLLCPDFFEDSSDPVDAVHRTLDTTGRAMLVTTIVLASGFFIFTFASMRNLFNFGLLTGFVILMALVADYLIAPALMVVVNRRKTT